MKYSIPLILFILNLCSCTNNHAPFIQNFSRTTAVNVEPLEAFSKDSIGNPDDLFSFGRYIVLSDPQTGKLLSIYDINNHAFKRLQNKGRGTNELIGIGQIGSDSDSTFYVVDPLSQHIAYYQINADSLKTTYTRFPANISHYFCHDTKEVYVQKGKCKYTIRDTTRHLNQHFGDEYSLPGFPSQIVSQLDGVSTVSFRQNRIAWFSCTGDILEIYDFNLPDSCQLIKRQIGVLPIVNKMKVKNREIPVFLPKTKLGVYSIASNEKYIFILYNENQIKDEITKKEAAYLSDNILVYDWDGNPIEILKLDQKVSAISYNHSDKHFYCLSHNRDAEVIVVKFRY